MTMAWVNLTVKDFLITNETITTKVKMLERQENKVLTDIGNIISNIMIQLLWSVWIGRFNCSRGKCRSQGPNKKGCSEKKIIYISINF